MGRLIIIIGCPRSGKSTIANAWSQYKITITNNNIYYNTLDNFPTTPRVVICSDDIRKACGARWNGFIEDYIHAIQGTMIKAFLARGYDVMVDGTNTTEPTLKKLLFYDPDTDFYIVDTPIETCIERAKETNQPDLIPVIERMDKQLGEWKNDPFAFINDIREKVRQQPRPRIEIV